MFLFGMAGGHAGAKNTIEQHETLVVLGHQIAEMQSENFIFREVEQLAKGWIDIADDSSRDLANCSAISASVSRGNIRPIMPQEELDRFAERNLPKLSHRLSMFLDGHMQGVVRC